MKPQVRRFLIALPFAIAALLLLWWLLGRKDPAAAPSPQADPQESGSVTELVEPPRLEGASRARVAGTTRTTADGRDTTASSGHWSLHFQVVSPEGAPHPLLLAWLLDDDERLVRSQWPDPEATKGRFLVTGACRLCVSAPPCRPWISDWLTPPSTGRLDIQVELRPGLAVAGRVYRQDGTTPLTSGIVTVECTPTEAALAPAVSSRRCLVDDQGAFLVEGLPPGRVRIRALAYDEDAGEMVHAEGEAGDRDIQLVLGVRPRLRLRLVDDESGLEPELRHAVVFVQTGGEETLWLDQITQRRPWVKRAVEPDTLEAEPGASYGFRVVALEFVQTDPVVVRAPLEGGTLDVEVRLRHARDRPARVSLDLSSELSPIPGHLNLVTHHDELPITRLVRVEPGQVALRLPPGRNHVCLESGWALRPRPARLPESVAWPDALAKAVMAEVDLDLEPGEERTVAAYLRRAGALFLAGTRAGGPLGITLTRGDEARRVIARGRMWNEEAGLSAGLVLPGIWSLQLVHDEREWQRDVEIRPGEVTVVRLR